MEPSEIRNTESLLDRSSSRDHGTVTNSSIVIDSSRRQSTRRLNGLHGVEKSFILRKLADNGSISRVGARSSNFIVGVVTLMVNVSNLEWRSVKKASINSLVVAVVDTLQGIEPGLAKDSIDSNRVAIAMV